MFVTSTFEELLKLKSPKCRVCDGQAAPTRHRNDWIVSRVDINGPKGLIAYLPEEYKIPRDSIAHEQLNEGAYKHPCLTTHLSRCRHMVFCLPMTSFHGQKIQARFFDEPTILEDYFALEQKNEVTKPHNGNPTIPIEGPEMDHQTYIRSEGFWIEWQYLHKTTAKRQVAESTMRVLKHWVAKLENERITGLRASIALSTTSKPLGTTINARRDRQQLRNAERSPSPVKSVPIIAQQAQTTSKAVGMNGPWRRSTPSPPAEDKASRIQGPWRRTENVTPAKAPSTTTPIMLTSTKRRRHDDSSSDAMTSKRSCSAQYAVQLNATIASPSPCAML